VTALSTRVVAETDPSAVRLEAAGTEPCASTTPSNYYRPRHPITSEFALTVLTTAAAPRVRVEKSWRWEPQKNSREFLRTFTREMVEAAGVETSQVVAANHLMARVFVVSLDKSAPATSFLSTGIVTDTPE
jgi:hypothetical protein